MLAASTEIVLAQTTIAEKDAPDWYINPPQYEDRIVVVAAADNFTFAVAKALANKDAPTRTQSEKIISNWSIGRISIETMHKSILVEELVKPIVPDTLTTATKVRYENSEGSLEVRFFEKVIIKEPETEFLNHSEIAKKNSRFADLLDELNRVGVEITHQTGPVTSYVMLVFPHDIKNR